MTRKLSLLWLIIFLAASTALAQHQSRLGQFQTDKIKGCNPLTITITVNAPFQCDSSNPCAVYYDFSNNPTLSEPLITPPFTHTYTQPGTYTLSILMGTQRDDIQVEVFPDTPPAFDVYNCGGNQVSVDITDTNYNQYIISYDDGTEVTVPVGNLATHNHTFASAGTKTISVRGRNLNADDNCTAAVKTVNVLDNIPQPSIARLEVLDETSLQLNYNILPDVLYRLEIATNNNSSFQFLKTVYNINNETIGNLLPDDRYYCFRLRVFNPCSNGTTAILSDPVCSANFDLSAQNNSNNLTWTTSQAGISNLRLEKITMTTSNTLTSTVTGSSFGDADIICGTEYCYRLTMNYPDDAQSISMQKCGTAISTDIPDPVFNITTIVDEPGVNIVWQRVPGFTPSEFYVHKSVDNSNTRITTTANTQYVDETYTSQSIACYRISYKDICDNLSNLSEAACPIRLTGNLQSDNTIDLAWSAYSGWRNGVAGYVLEKYNPEGQLLQSIDVGTGLSFADDDQDLNNQAYIYRLRANAVEPGLPQSVSNPVTLIKDPNLFYPTGFTPNGDNLNDIFNVFGQYIIDFEMNIFNRWGELLYTTTDLSEGWDGTFKGNEMPEGTYTFVANITDRAGRTFKKSGSVLLLRKR